MNYDDSTPKKSTPPHQPPKNVTTVNDKNDKRTPVSGRDTDEKMDDDQEYDENPFRGSSKDYPPSSTYYEKISKENAEYRKGVPFENCGKCTYYISGHCKVVRGYIAQEMVCKYFSEKYTASSFGVMVVKRK